MRSAASSRGPRTSSTWDFRGPRDLIRSMSNGCIFCDMKQERRAAQRFASTHESPSDGPVLEVHLSSSRIVSQITAYRNVPLKWTPKPVQQRSFHPRKHLPGAGRLHQGQMRRHRRRLECDGGKGCLIRRRRGKQKVLRSRATGGGERKRWDRRRRHGGLDAVVGKFDHTDEETTQPRPRSRIDRRFPPLGVTPMPSYGCPPYKGGVAHPGGARV